MTAELILFNRKTAKRLAPLPLPARKATGNDGRCACTPLIPHRSHACQNLIQHLRPETDPRLVYD
ncbi:hypothetical protein [Pseudomonas asplenii]|uniref:hypothetical protein n=1 Tax=Pseudomonas asplenii TaxID=53407 RepID=UPI000A9B3110|nr:hypothetical protein [Pseudomonas fuscovaginae]